MHRGGEQGAGRWECATSGAALRVYLDGVRGTDWHPSALQFLYRPRSHGRSPPVGAAVCVGGQGAPRRQAQATAKMHVSCIRTTRRCEWLALRDHCAVRTSDGTNLAPASCSSALQTAVPCPRAASPASRLPSLTSSQPPTAPCSRPTHPVNTTTRRPGIRTSIRYTHTYPTSLSPSPPVPQPPYRSIAGLRELPSMHCAIEPIYPSSTSSTTLSNMYDTVCRVHLCNAARPRLARSPRCPPFPSLHAPLFFLSVFLRFRRRNAAAVTYTKFLDY